MNARVLIIEDVREMADLIALYLEKEGIESVIRERAEEGLEILGKEDFDLVVLDLNLPGMDGFEFLQKLRRFMDIPVVIVSARDADEDIVTGLGIGADEFVTKPFSPKVLAARVRALLRRQRESLGPSRKTISFGPYLLDLEAYLLRRDDQRIPLSSREFDVLSFLAVNPGKAFSPETIYAEVWKNAYGDLTTIAVYIQRLRKKLEEDYRNPRYLETIYGKGYRFNPEGGNGQ